MLGIKHIKFDTTLYVVHYKGGKIKREGRGLSFYYYAPNSSIVAIPFGSDDVQFIFNESTVDFQTISIQGQITYKVEDPKQLAELLDFTVDSAGKYKKNDIEKLHQRLINEAQTATSAYIQSLELKQALRSAKSIENKIMEGLTVSKAVKILGIEPLGVNVVAVKAEPQTAKALEAATRESLQKEADLAIYERRNFAVEQERTIKESELNTDIAVEEKKKQISEKKMESEVLREENDRKLREMRIDADTSVEKKKMQGQVLKEENSRKLREMRMDADLDIEQRRKELVDIQVNNKKKESDAEAYHIMEIMKAYRDIDWKVLSALNYQKGDAEENIAFAFRELAENAQKVENLNISPELLQSLTKKKK